MLIWLIVLVPVALGVLAQRRVAATFRRYRAVPNHGGVTGAEVAGALLRAHGLSDIRVELAPGTLSDHYDPQAHALRLSRPVATEKSVAAIGIAAHEVAHAYQDAEGSRAYRARKRVGEPLQRLAPWSGIFLFGGLFFGSLPLLLLACLYMGGLVIFSIVTLPVELGASRRAVSLLQGTGVANAEEVPEVRHVLTAAAFTYAAGIAQQLGLFLAVLIAATAGLGLHL
jgi:Zn-dependent membrane protease YugP